MVMSGNGGGFVAQGTLYVSNLLGLFELALYSATNKRRFHLANETRPEKPDRKMAGLVFYQ